jgi:hypothetical protein
MFQNLSTTFYKASKYRCSSPALWQTPINMYNRCIQVYSKIKTNSELYIVPKKYVKHTAKPQSTENLLSLNKAKKFSRVERSRLLKGKQHDRINNPNYNPYSPLFEKEYNHRKRTPNMSNKLARINFRTMLNSANNAVKAVPPSKNVTFNVQPTADLTEHTKTSSHEPTQTTIDNTITLASTNVLLERVSDKYAPKNLAIEPTKNIDYAHFSGNKDNSFALVVRIGQKPTEKLQMNEGRILTAIITSLQNVMPYIRIVPLENKRAHASDIQSPADIFFDEEFYSNYMEKPTYTKKRHLIFRLHFISKKPFFWYRKNLQLQQWLKSEMIRFEENNISEIHCPKVGFLTDCHPRVSLIATYEDRIKQIFHGMEIPEFYCAVDNVSVRHATTKVIVIRSAEADVNTFQKLFRKATHDNINTFIPWNQWIAMIPAKQLDLIQRQNSTLTNLKSIILSGFKNDETIRFNYSATSKDDSIMDDESEEAPTVIDDKTGNMTVNEFLLNKYKDINGTPIFQFCYPVSLGIRELNVTAIHAYEAIHLCKEIKEDMLLYMSNDAANAIFEDVQAIKDRAKTHSPWVPYDIEQNYHPVESGTKYEQDKNDHKKTKRTNTNVEAQKNESQSYKNVVLKYSTKEPKLPSTNSNQPLSDPSIDLFNSLTDEIKSFQSRLIILKENQEYYETKMEKRTTKLIKDMETMKQDNETTKNDVTSIKHQMQEMTTKSWMENKLENMDNKFEKMDKVMDFMMNFMHHNHNVSDKHQQYTENMMVDKEVLKRNSQAISAETIENSLLFDSDKENFASGGNHINCNNNKPEYFGHRCP